MWQREYDAKAQLDRATTEKRTYATIVLLDKEIQRQMHTNGAEKARDNKTIRKRKNGTKTPCWKHRTGQNKNGAEKPWDKENIV